MLKFSLFIFNSIQLTQIFSHFRHSIAFGKVIYFFHSALYTQNTIVYLVFFLSLSLICIIHVNFCCCCFFCVRLVWATSYFQPKCKFTTNNRVWMSLRISIQIRHTHTHDLRTSHIVFELIWFSFGAEKSKTKGATVKILCEAAYIVYI